MRTRFMGASSYDDEMDDDEQMDLSGFITSSETQPLVVERKRNTAPKAEPAAEGMGNAGPRNIPPPPMANVGYAPRFVESAAANEGSPWNPVWAHDDAKLKRAAVISKSAGMMMAVGGVAFAAGKRQLKGMPIRLIAGGTAMYLHPALGYNHGYLHRKFYPLANMGGPGLKATKFVKQVGKLGIHAAGAAAFATLVKRGGLKKE